MNWDAVGAVGSILGAIAVVATLFYLARQIKENSKQLRVTSINAMNELINSGFDPIYNSDRNTTAWLVGLSTPDKLDDLDRQLFELFMGRLMQSFQTAVTQYRHGGLEEADFKRYLGTFKGFLESPGGQMWLSRIGSEFLDEDALQLLGDVKSRLGRHLVDDPSDQ